MSEEVVSGEDWDTVRVRLEDVLRRLRHRGFVTLDPPVPASTAERRRGFLDRLRGREAPRSRPLVQLSHDGEALDAECSGPLSGRSMTDFPWTPEQERRLLELGWRTPDPLDDWHMYRWRGDDGEAAGSQPEAARQAAALAVATLRDVYGMASPEGLTVVVDELP